MIQIGDYVGQVTPILRHDSLKKGIVVEYSKRRLLRSAMADLLIKIFGWNLKAMRSQS